MNYSNIRIVNQPFNPALGWTTINQGPNSIQIPSRPPFYGPSIGNNMPSSGGSQPSGSQMMPTTPAPNFTPQKNQNQFSTFAIDAGSISGCLGIYLAITFKSRILALFNVCRSQKYCWF